MWQTPVSRTSPWNSTPFASSSARVAATSSTCSAGWPFFCGANSMPKLFGSQMPKHVSPAHTSYFERSSGRSPTLST